MASPLSPRDRQYLLQIPVPKNCAYQYVSELPHILVTDKFFRPDSIVLIQDFKILGILDTDFILPFRSHDRRPVFGILPHPECSIPNLSQSILTTNGLILSYLVLSGSHKDNVDQEIVQDSFALIETDKYDLTLATTLIAPPNNTVCVFLNGEIPGNEHEFELALSQRFKSKTPHTIRLLPSHTSIDPRYPQNEYQDNFLPPTTPSIPSPYDIIEDCAMLTFTGNCEDPACLQNHEVCMDQIFQTCEDICGKIHLDPEIKKLWITSHPTLAQSGRAKAQADRLLRAQSTPSRSRYDLKKIYPREELERMTFMRTVLSSTLHASILNGEKCMVCSMPFDEDDVVITLPCLHKACEDCLNAWITREYAIISENKNNNQNNNNSPQTEKNPRCPSCNIPIMKLFLDQTDVTFFSDRH